jgi:pentatricopeptide repeat protein
MGNWRRRCSFSNKCNKKEQGQNVLELFQQMQQESVQPDSVAFLGVLNACARIVALEEDRCVHQQIVEDGWDSDVFVGRSLLDMYAKCGSMEDAWRVFNKMPSQDLVTWTAILVRRTMHGHGMQVDEGMRCYASMVTD